MSKRNAEMAQKGTEFMTEGFITYEGEGQTILWG